MGIARLGAILALRSAGIAAEILRKVTVLGSNHAVTQAVIAGVGVSFVSAVSVKDELVDFGFKDGDIGFMEGRILVIALVAIATNIAIATVLA